MSALARQALKPPAFKYKPDPAIKDMEKVALYQEFQDGRKLKKYSVVFDGTGGPEALLYGEESFRKNAAKLDYENIELFENYEETLAGGAEDNWNAVNANDAYPFTNLGFDAAIRAFYLRYSAIDARDTLFEYLNTNECSKPRSVDPLDYCNRIQTMVRRGNRMHGAHPPLDEEKTKSN